MTPPTPDTDSHDDAQPPRDWYDPTQSPPRRDPGQQRGIRAIMQILWPAFLASAVTVGILFSFVDPLQIDTLSDHWLDSREAVYTVSFLFFWLMFSAACALSWYLASSEQSR